MPPVSLYKVGELYFGLSPHVFHNPAGKLIVTGPDVSDTSIIDPATWTVSDTQDFPPLGAMGGRREPDPARPGQPARHPLDGPLGLGSRNPRDS